MGRRPRATAWTARATAELVVTIVLIVFLSLTGAAVWPYVTLDPYTPLSVALMAVLWCMAAFATMFLFAAWLAAVSVDIAIRAGRRVADAWNVIMYFAARL